MTDKNVDETKGRVKEAAGSLSGDDSLKNEGKADRAAGSAKDKVDKVTDKTKDLLGDDKSQPSPLSFASIVGKGSVRTW